MPTKVKDYLIARLAALGGKHLFCVAGNYTAAFLVAAQDSGKIQCVPTTNEMEAGYAADAYARLTRKIGVCCVTYGVGSFSALNAFAGSYVEYCPVVFINGSAPAAKANQLVKQGVLFAHAIDPVRTDELVFRQITDPLRRPGDPPLTAIITDPFDAPEQIDALLRACVASGRPVYLEVRQDVWGMECADPEDPDAPLCPKTDRELTAEQEVAAEAAVTAVLERVSKASQPVLWAGELLQRQGLEETLKQLIQQSRLPYTTTLMGKGIIPETEYPEQFIGVYDSVFAPKGVKKAVEKSDCLIALGTLLGDFYGPVVADHWTVGEREEARLIVAAATGVRIGNDLYPDVPLRQFVIRLAARWPGTAALAAPEPLPGLAELVQRRQEKIAGKTGAAADPDDAKITWDSFFHRIGSWIEPDMVLLLDASLALFPGAEIPIQTQGRFVAQSAWLSIGYTVGAAVGASFALPDSRPVSFVGDGGFQMIAQAFSTLVKNRRRSVLFVFDNQLYGIEQYLVDMQVLPPERRYFQNAGKVEPSFFDVIPDWDYEKLAEAFGGKGYQVSTTAELETALADLAARPDAPAIVAVKLDPTDLPAEIRASLPAAARAQSAAEAVAPLAAVAEMDVEDQPAGIAVVAFN